MNDTLKKPSDWDEMYPGRFMKAGEINGNTTLTITAVEIDELPDEKAGTKVKGVVSFAEIKQQLALNKTNGICMKAMFGRSVQDWVGKHVTLFRDKWNGDDCIRVYGSPDIRSDMQVEVKLPRKGIKRMTMHAVKSGRAVAGDGLYRIPVGPHKGKTLQELDAATLTAFLANPKINANVKTLIEAEMVSRTNSEGARNTADDDYDGPEGME